MKKLVAIFLTVACLFALVACNNNDTSSTATSSAAESEANSKEASDASSAAEVASSEAESSAEESSEASAEEESSVNEVALPEYLPSFIYVAGQVYAMKATDPDSIRLTKINDVPESGDVVLYTNEYGSTIKTGDETFADYALLVVEYNKSKYMYLEKEVIALDSTADKSAVAIPSDGFVVAVHKDQAAMLKVLDRVKEDIEIYPCGVSVYDFQYKLNKVDTPFEIDGSIGSEWDNYLIDSVDYDNPNWDYRQFAEGDYGIAANVYGAYDADNFYFAVVVDSPSCYFSPTVSSDPGGMWKYECLQFNTLNQSPLSDYMLQHFQYANDTQATVDHVARQYGFSGSAEGTAYTQIWWGADYSAFTGKLSVVRDDDNEMTYYEVSIPWAELNIDPATVATDMQFSFSVSINSTTEELAAAGGWQNIRMRNGGGIIGMNEFSKMPVVTLG